METNNLSLSNRFDPLQEIEKALTHCLQSIRSSVASHSNPSPPLLDRPLEQTIQKRSAIIDQGKLLHRSDVARFPSNPQITADHAINNLQTQPKSNTPYKTALIKPRENNDDASRKFWQVKKGAILQISRGAKIRQKIEAIKASSSPGNPSCFKCGSPGHAISTC